MRGKNWTPEEDALLVELLYQGKEYLEIAKLMDRTFNSVRHRAFHTGNSRKKITTQKMIDKNRIWGKTASDN